jgi:hypothetical protein
MKTLNSYPWFVAYLKSLEYTYFDDLDLPLTDFAVGVIENFRSLYGKGNIEFSYWYENLVDDPVVNSEIEKLFNIEGFSDLLNSLLGGWASNPVWGKSEGIFKL